MVREVIYINYFVLFKNIFELQIKVDIKFFKVIKFQYVIIVDFIDIVGDGISFFRGESVEVGFFF